MLGNLSHRPNKLSDKDGSGAFIKLLLSLCRRLKKVEKRWQEGDAVTTTPPESESFPSGLIGQPDYNNALLHQDIVMQWLQPLQRLFQELVVWLLGNLATTTPCFTLLKILWSRSRSRKIFNSECNVLLKISQKCHESVSYFLWCRN